MQVITLGSKLETCLVSLELAVPVAVWPSKGGLRYTIIRHLTFVWNWKGTNLQASVSSGGVLASMGPGLSSTSCYI